MKYNICGFDQRKLCSFIEENKEMGKSLDCTDLVILNWIADFSVRASVKKVIMDGIQYAWIAYKKIVEDLPFIPISKRAFAERFDKLHAFGLIEKRIEKESGIGTFMYIRVLPKFEELLYDNSNNEKRQNDGGCCSNSRGLTLEQQPDAVQTAYKDKLTIQDNYNKKETKKDKSFLERKENEDFYNSLLSLNVDANVAMDYIKLRKAKKATNSKRAFALVERAISEVTAKLNITPTNVIEICLARGWYGCQVSYFDNIKLSDFGIEPQSPLYSLGQTKYYGGNTTETQWE